MNICLIYMFLPEAVIFIFNKEALVIKDKEIIDV